MEKLIEKEIDNTTFKKKVKDTIGIENSINYYGMIEQTGSIYLECKYGFLHTSIFSDIIIRRPDYSLSLQKEKVLYRPYLYYQLAIQGII